jgi:hypothetical protein
MPFKLFSTACLLAFCLLHETGKAQNPFHLAIETGTTASYSGVNTFVELHVVKGKHDLYGGPRINLTTTYLPAKLPLGMNAGYRYKFAEKEKVYGMFWAVYENLNLKNAGPEAFIHEFYGAIGAGKSSKNDKFNFCGALGSGGVIESFVNPFSGKKDPKKVMGGWARVSASYRLF